MDIKKLFLIAVLALLSGCASAPPRPSVSVYVDSLASPLAESNTSFILLPGNDGVRINDLQFQEYANYLTRALKARGYTPANSTLEADLAIFLSYGIGDPETQKFTHSMPIYGETGIASSRTTGTVTTFGESKIINTTTTNVPSYGITGYETVTGSETTYSRFVKLAAFDLKKFKEKEEEIQLWQTTITSTGSSGDLRQVFPVLIGASTPYLAVDTGQKVHVSVFENDTYVQIVKGHDVDTRPSAFGVICCDIYYEGRVCTDNNEGVTIISVIIDSPAYHAKLKSGDILKRVGSDYIFDGYALLYALERYKGQTVEVEYQRDGHTNTVSVVL